MNQYAFVPARGGSKRIPGKNVRDFLGKPVLLRVLETLRDSEIFSEIIVSTDSLAIRDAVNSWGFNVPFIRPSELATDEASTAVVAQHAISWFLDNGANSNDSFLLAYPTAVFMSTSHLSESFEFFRSSGADLLFSACAFPSNIERAWRKQADQSALPVDRSNQSMRSQQFESSYFDAGQFYWSSAKAWEQRQGDYARVRQVMFEIDPLEAVDINTEEDWVRAERYFRLLRGESQ